MKNLLFAMLLLCLFCTCKKDPYANLCGGKDPINSLPWLKAKIDTLQKFSSSNPIIYRFSYQNVTYFYQSSTCTNCNWNPVFYNCDGNIAHTTQEQSADFMNALYSNKEIIWRAN